MPTTTDFISELVRAANEIERLRAYETRRLLERAGVTIRDMREAAGIPSSRTAADAVVDLQAVQGRLFRGVATRDQAKVALLDAAAMIRDLHIMLDSGTEIDLLPGN
ncbi:hypothetical protein [Rhizobium halophilum]|uniref:hypothetical protein n=1 Tax=Rhizobium halophilum TaxID=2846852 RepID=UPI001EFE67CC|nr:hypothetical protein [Rhizobium halophilum]MCF6370704.1 hypothetical protein [Rhizobium halophilum]